MILVTGVAGFIGFHYALKQLEKGYSVIGIDNINDYYDVNLKYARLAQLEAYSNFTFEKLDISDRESMADFFDRYPDIDQVVHLAAQAGVRYSLENPLAYIDSNAMGFATVLEGARKLKVKHLVYASTSSVYGANVEQPFAETHTADHPLTIYSATKRFNEMAAHAYAHLYDLPTTGLRFFTVYGPWGRPDMALFKFTRNIIDGKPIDVYNHGQMMRDFTYVDDIVQGIDVALANPPQKSIEKSQDRNYPVNQSHARFRVFNIAKGEPTPLMDYIAAIEKHLGKKANINYLPLQDGDMLSTMADISGLSALGYKPNTSVDEGVGAFVAWYRGFYD